MIRAIIIDDELDCIQSLENELTYHCKEVDILGRYSNPKEGIKGIHQHKPDVVFLDIEMPVINGFELLELIPNINFDVIFTTAYDNFALRAFKVCAVDYLLKPVDPDELKTAVSKLQKRPEGFDAKGHFNFLLQHLEEAEQNNVKRIAVPTFEGLDFIQLQDILYCESDGAYSIIHFISGSKSVISKSLKYLEDILAHYRFFRVHKSYIVNLDYVIKYSRGPGGTLKLTNGQEIRVARSKKDELLSLFDA